MKTEHTPAPWLRSRSGNQFQIVAGSDLNGEPNELIATVHPAAITIDREPCDETRANARLVASAPDLLSALEALLHSAESLHASCDHSEPKSFEIARAAIAKAKGEA